MLYFQCEVISLRETDDSGKGDCEFTGAVISVRGHKDRQLSFRLFELQRHIGLSLRSHRDLHAFLYKPLFGVPVGRHEVRVKGNLVVGQGTDSLNNFYGDVLDGPQEGMDRVG